MRTFGHNQSVGRHTAAKGRTANDRKERIMRAGELHDCSEPAPVLDWNFTHSKEGANLPAEKLHTGQEPDLRLSGEPTLSVPTRSAVEHRQRRSARLLVAAGLVLLLSAVSVGYLFYLARQIERQSSIDEARPADVIIVLGAAEYRGRPSPVLQSRLDHALSLYRQGLAPYILTTGGAGGDPDFTEGEVGRDYLAEHGVRSEDIITEAEGATTAQSLDSAAETMHRMNLHSCIVVSDGYHIYRVKRLLQAQGIEVYGSPRQAARALSHNQLRWLYLKQALGFALWQVGINI
jgi:uncharacterized SAM-binding protein YcdF (DUF218 family)